MWRRLRRRWRQCRRDVDDQRRVDIDIDIERWIGRQLIVDQRWIDIDGWQLDLHGGQLDLDRRIVNIDRRFLDFDLHGWVFIIHWRLLHIFFNRWVIEQHIFGRLLVDRWFVEQHVFGCVIVDEQRRILVHKQQHQQRRFIVDVDQQRHLVEYVHERELVDQW